jgi:hypothetical protein
MGGLNYNNNQMPQALPRQMLNLAAQPNQTL